MSCVLQAGKPVTPHHHPGELFSLFSHYSIKAIMPKDNNGIIIMVTLETRTKNLGYET